MLRLLWKAHRWARGFAPYATIVDWLKARWLEVSAMLGLSGLGAWFASAVDAVHSLGWGAWPFVGALFAFIVVATIALAVFIRNALRGYPSSGGVLLRPDSATLDVSNEPDVVPTAHDGQGTSTSDIDHAAHNELMLFVLDYIIPAGEAQRELQEVMITIICGNETVARLAIQGIAADYRIATFRENLSYLYGAFCGSPMTHVPLDEMMERVDKIERNYKAFCDQAEDIARSAGVDHRTHSILAARWEEWRSKHNALVREYEAIKRDHRFPKLLRPGRESRWGGMVPPAEAGDAPRSG